MMSVTQALCAAQGGTCFYCAVPFDGPVRGRKHKRNPRAWTHDHVKPASKGNGRHRNLVLACALCNQEKAARDPTPEECARAEQVQEEAILLFRRFNGHHPDIWETEEEAGLRRYYNCQLNGYGFGHCTQKG